MEFRILGPLEIVTDGTVTRPRGVEARLLAVLLLDAGRAVSLARLVEGVWDGDPPATAGRQVSNTVSALRRRHGGGWIQRIGDGYRLDPSAITVDWLRFEELVTRARTGRGTDPATALAGLREALALWRGTALADLPGRVIESGARSFEESRLAAMEDCFDLELEAGDSVEVARAAQRLLADHPYRQKLVGQLMLALHRQQRTPEALTVFEQARARLAEDLGLDPGEPLRRLHTAILRADPSLVPSAPEPAAPPPTDPPVPAQLPVPPWGFTGRATHLDQLNDAVTGASRSCVLTGAAGTGKTALAVHWAHHVHERFPDGQLFINLRGFDHGEPVTPAEALSRFIRAINGPDTPVPSDLDEAITLYRTVLDGKRILVVLDNAHDAAQVRPLLPSTTDGFAVVTSRHRLRGLTAVDASVPIGLSPLSQHESSQLLATAVDSVDADAAAVDKLAALCGHLPLALRIAAAQLATRPGDIAQLVADLDGPRRLDALSLDGDPEATVATALERSYEALDADACELLLALGVVPGDDYARELIAAVSRFEAGDTHRALDRLETLHLVEQHHPGRYRFHDLTRLYVAARAENGLDAETRDVVLDAFIDWHHDRRQDTADAEDANVYIACHALRHHPRLWKLISSQIGVINSGRRFEQVKAIIDLGLSTLEDNGDPEAEFWIYRLLASYHWATGQLEEGLRAGYHAADIAADLDSAARLTITATLCAILDSLGRLAEAAAQLRAVIGEISEEDDWERLFNWRMNLCGIAITLGEYDDARDLLSTCEAQLARHDFPVGAVSLYANRAYLQLESGEFAKAAASADVALTKCREFHHARFECQLLVLRTEARRRSGETDQAVADLDRALEMADELQLPSVKVEALRELIMHFHGRGMPSHAYEYQRLLATADLAENLEVPARADRALARSVAHFGVGELDQAIKFATEAVDLNARMPRPLHHARALSALADAHNGLDEPDTARKLRAEALDIFTELGVPEAERLRTTTISPL